MLAQDVSGKIDLPKRQARFVEEYLVDLNGTQAAIRAGYAESGARVQAARLLANDNIRAVVAARQQQRAERTRVDQDRVIEEYARIAFSDLRALLDEDGRVIPIHELSPDISAAVKKIKVRIEHPRGQDEPAAQVIEIELHDKLAALAKLAKHVGNAKQGAVQLTTLADAIHNRIAAS